ncbi:hypothetical protein MKZ38_001178 [Zalerion maritima]|uniref:RRM domain-containing protein n=1 Tax=Zalerion maritima TaxID=339359 RepID=A0AAD5RZP8_9PEZI|nr:hypothetical protein MKZ38_001178 [Zalerion maritima]
MTSRSRNFAADGTFVNIQIVVEKLTKNVDEDHLREIFGTYGPIRDLDLPMNRQFGTNRGTAYILFINEADAEAAIAHMHEAQIDGAIINVSIVLSPVVGEDEGRHQAEAGLEEPEPEWEVVVAGMPAQSPIPTDLAPFHDPAPPLLPPAVTAVAAVVPHITAIPALGALAEAATAATIAAVAAQVGLEGEEEEAVEVVATRRGSLVARMKDKNMVGVDRKTSEHEKEKRLKTPKGIGKERGSGN